MSRESHPLAEISAIRILCREISTVNTVCFLNQFAPGYGNNTIEHDDLFGTLTVDTVMTESRRQHTAPGDNP